MSKSILLNWLALFGLAQDVSAELASRCEWVDQYLVCDVSDERLGAMGSYDIISLTHVIEHLLDPVVARHRCKSLLANGGTICITAPFRPKGWEMGRSTISQWQQYSYNHVPTHIQYFSEEYAKNGRESRMHSLLLGQWAG